MSQNDNEFYNLLKTLVQEQTFALDLFSRPEKIAVKYLNTSQLKELIKTVVDNPLTQPAFNSSCTKIFKESLVISSPAPLNILDRLMFIIKTRIHSISPNVKNIQTGEVVDFNIIADKLLQKNKENFELFQPKRETEGPVNILFGVPLIDTEHQLNEEIYKHIKIDTSKPEEISMLLGDSFINEIAKAIQIITVKERTFDLSTVSFKERLKLIELLPASLIQKVIEYIEAYKQNIEDCMTVNGQVITLDASLFSVR
jgi:hypothetical protein